MVATSKKYRASWLFVVLESPQIVRLRSRLVSCMSDSFFALRALVDWALTCSLELIPYLHLCVLFEPHMTSRYPRDLFGIASKHGAAKLTGAFPSAYAGTNTMFSLLHPGQPITCPELKRWRNWRVKFDTAHKLGSEMGSLSWLGWMQGRRYLLQGVSNAAFLGVHSAILDREL